jgi:hypothetical protein
VNDEELALAWADPVFARRVQDIADLAASYHDMTTIQQEAFDQTVRAACDVQPVLRAALVACGVVMCDGRVVVQCQPEGDAVDRLADSLSRLLLLFWDWKVLAA